MDYDVKDKISKDFITEQIKSEYLTSLTTQSSTRPESIATLSPFERLQLVFDLIQEDSRLFADFKLSTAGEIFSCLQEIDDIGDIKRLKPGKKAE